MSTPLFNFDRYRELSGSMVLVRNKKLGFIPRQIILHMKLLAQQTGREKALSWHHAETLMWNFSTGRMETFGAREHGTQRSPANEYYADKEFLIRAPFLRPGLNEETHLWAFYNRVRNSKYQYGNFLAWIHFMKTHHWWGKKGEKRNYCFELAARAAHAIDRWPEGKSLDCVSIYDLYENAYYYDYYSSLEGMLAGKGGDYAGR